MLKSYYFEIQCVIGKIGIKKLHILLCKKKINKFSKITFFLEIKEMIGTYDIYIHKFFTPC